MVRVLQVVTSMEKGGIENMLMNLYRKIDREKVQFDFLLHKDKKAEFETEIEQLGGKIYRLPERSLLKPAEYFKALDSFFKTHQEYRIVHSHIDEQSAYILKYAKKNGVPVRIAHSHNSNRCGGIKGMIKAFCKANINGVCTDRFACGEKAGRYLFGDEAFDKGFVTILKNGIDCDRFRYSEEKRNEIRERFGFTDEIVLGHVGRFDEQKNHLFLIDVLNKIRNCGVNAKLLLLGDGNLRREVEAKVKMLGLTDSVVFAGVVSDVYNYLNAMDVFVFPSVYEGLPLTLIEAQANGLRVFASDAVSEESDVTGLIDFLPLSSGTEKWAEKIKEKIPFERAETVQLIKNAGYDARTSAKQLEDFYLEKARTVEEWKD